MRKSIKMRQAYTPNWVLGLGLGFGFVFGPGTGAKWDGKGKLKNAVLMAI